MTSNDIRQSYLDFFVQKHGHTFVPSSSVVPHDDPTLLFANAGMNQFKPIFLGTEKRAYTRAVNTQKCIRAGGKHNDLDDVGRSRRHHTFFEMLGNWSFGDYFKRGAIEMAWELLTQVWKLDPTRLHVTVHEGDAAAGVARDDEAAEYGDKSPGLSDAHIHFADEGQFLGNGRDRPVRAVHGDLLRQHARQDGRPDGVVGSDPRVMEIWNNVFIQFNRNADRSLTKLPAQHVDTGMGFERICQVLQNKGDNYATDLWTPLLTKIGELTGATYGGTFPASDLGDRSNESPELKRDIAFRVIADHARMATFAITDGAKPDNKGETAFVRSVIRRAVRFGYQQFTCGKPFLHELVADDRRPDGRHVSGVEEGSEARREGDRERRGELLSDDRARTRSLRRSDRASDPNAATKSLVLAAKDSFDLHTTYGFPVDLQEQMALERGVAIDHAGYRKLFDEFQKKSGEGRKKHVTVAVDLSKFAETDDAPKYAGREATGTILGLDHRRSARHHWHARAGRAGVAAAGSHELLRRAGRADRRRRAHHDADGHVPRRRHRAARQARAPLGRGRSRTHRRRAICGRRRRCASRRHHAEPHGHGT